MLGEDVDAALWLRTAPRPFNIEAQGSHLGAAEAERSTGGASGCPILGWHASLAGLTRVEPRVADALPIASFHAGRPWLRDRRPALRLRSLLAIWAEHVGAGAPP